MKNLALCFAAAALLFTACNTPSPAPAPAPAPKPAPELAKAKFPVNCFENRMPDGSVISFQYTEYYDDIVGILDYTFTDKDGAHGTFKGKKEGDIITATWNYTIEGSEQTEQVMFKIEGDKATRASGELTEGKDGSLHMKDPAHAKWEETFSRVRCD